MGAYQDEIEEAAKQAHAHDFIVALPQGYQTQVRPLSLSICSLRLIDNYRWVAADAFSLEDRRLESR